MVQWIRLSNIRLYLVAFVLCDNADSDIAGIFNFAYISSSWSALLNNMLIREEFIFMTLNLLLSYCKSLGRELNC